MEFSTEFDLKSAIKYWEQSNLSKQELTPSDKKELTEHFLLTLEEIKNKGLSEEEAFAATCVRFGSKKYWGNSMQELNDDSFQLKKLVLLLGGVLFFLFCNYFVLCIHRITLNVLNSFSGDITASVESSGIVIDTVYLFSFLVITISIFGKKARIVNYIGRIRLNPKRVIILMFIVIILFIIERYSFPQMKNLISDRGLISHFYIKERDFNIIFPFLFGIGFILTYFKYYKTAEV